jgi:hypothetical protein
MTIKDEQESVLSPLAYFSKLFLKESFSLVVWLPPRNDLVAEMQDL